MNGPVRKQMKNLGTNQFKQKRGSGMWLSPRNLCEILEFVEKNIIFIKILTILRVRTFLRVSEVWTR